MQVIKLLQDIYNLSVNIKLEIERTKIFRLQRGSTGASCIPVESIC